MTLFKSLYSPTAPVFETDRCFVRSPEEADFAQWAALRSESRTFLQPYEPRWPLDELSRQAFRRRLRRYAQDVREKSGYAFFAFTHGDGQLVGGFTLSHVRFGVSQSCALGYWMGKPYAGKGYMSEILPAAFPFIFEELGLHRIEAACLPNNRSSIRLLMRLGFQEEGLARGYLKINGQWQDHRLFAKLSSDPYR